MSQKRLVDRILNCLPAATFEMATFCRLAGVEESDEIPTAAVSVEGRPRLVVNPSFVAEHCERDEHLYLLVMHELWHVLLAHTRLYPRVSAAHNVAFDAVINAGLCRQHPEPEYTAFFCRLNPHDAFPALLLRPPPGWPHRPVYPAVGPAGTEGLLRRLYPAAADVESVPEPTYAEILELLAGWDGGDGDEPVLLGDHREESADGQAMSDPLLADIVREIVGKWPPPPFHLGGRDEGGDERGWPAVVAPPGEATRAAFARLLRRLVWAPNRRARPERRRAVVVTDAGTGVVPNPRDRLAVARRRLGLAPTLWHQRVPVPRRQPEPRRSIRAYLDVSGSMAAVIGHLCGLLAPYAARGDVEVLQFSTAVFPIAVGDLAAGRLRTTYGTDGDCVWRDLLERPGARRALVLTDGYVGRPERSLAEGIARRGIEVHVVLPAESAWRRDVARIARSVTVLPPLSDRRGAA